MTREQLTKYIDNIDDKIIEEAASYKRENRNNNWIAKAALVAACVCVVIGVCIAANINSNQVIAKQNVIDAGKYYTIYELFRDFGNEQGKELSKQYQFVVYNGKCVLYSGISVNEKPDIRQISENIMRVEYKTNGVESVTYCDLGMTTGECTVTVTDEILLEWDERYACLYYERGIPSVAICNMESDYWGDYWIDSVILEKGVSDVEVSVNEKHDKITVSYVNQDGEYKTEKRKLSKQVIGERLPIENETEVQCHWENKLIKEGDNYYTYDVSLVINRRDNNKHTKQYQYFVKHDGKVIDGGYSKGTEPVFENVDGKIAKIEYVVDDNYLGMEDTVISKYYDLNNGKISDPYESVLYEWKDRVAYLSEKINAHQFLEICDMFSGDLMQREAFDEYVCEVNNFELNEEATELTVYYTTFSDVDDDDEIEVKQTIKLSNEKMSEEEINTGKLLIRDDDIARVYDITEKQSLAQYQYFILDNEGGISVL